MPLPAAIVLISLTQRRRLRSDVERCRSEERLVRMFVYERRPSLSVSDVVVVGGFGRRNTADEGALDEAAGASSLLV